VPLDWLGLGGWGGVQHPGSSSSGGFSDIMEVTHDQCNNGVCCLEGSYCNYACPPGLLGYQWPSTQGSTGQSVGGLLCKGGKLYKTNSAYNTLCASGATEVNVFVQNKLSQNVAICQTMYPG
jgi:SUN family beta-glucosidase